MVDFRKQWLANLKVNDFVDSIMLRDNGFSTGIIISKTDYISVEFQYNNEKAVLQYDANGVFIAIKSGSDKINFPKMSGDQIIVAKENRIESFIANQFYRDSKKILDEVNELFDIHFNIDHPNPPVSNEKRIKVINSLTVLRNKLKE